MTPERAHMELSWRPQVYTSTPEERASRIREDLAQAIANHFSHIPLEAFIVPQHGGDPLCYHIKHLPTKGTSGEDQLIAKLSVYDTEVRVWFDAYPHVQPSREAQHVRAQICVLGAAEEFAQLYGRGLCAHGRGITSVVESCMVGEQISETGQAYAALKRPRISHLRKVVEEKPLKLEYFVEPRARERRFG